MPYINSTSFGKITVDETEYAQVLITGGKVFEREYAKLKDIFGTSHRIGSWEIEELLKNDPELIIFGIGQDGMMEVTKEDLEAFKGIEILINLTPEAIELYNTNFKNGKRVNALIHTTC